MAMRCCIVDSIRSIMIVKIYEQCIFEKKVLSMIVDCCSQIG